MREKIVEILNASDPEDELEKYYDIAPNNYLKEFCKKHFQVYLPGNLDLFLEDLELDCIYRQIQ